ncbi:MAG: SufS family cysteine desulfurase [Bacilli bacterium]|nr:SufS family cysteine desulfurase [Bacilli bacterium]MDD4831838.1 SufS family cysteine desulfurase [Bacilli bacterium]
MNREDFPMLKEKYIYFNNAATSFKPIEVINEINDYYTKYNSNINRGIDSLSYYSTNKYEEVRNKVANFINANNNEIVFTRGTTDSINLLAYSLEDIINENDEIIISIIEHHSNFVPWQKLCKRKKAKLIVLDVEKNGTISPSLLKNNINTNTKIVALNHVSNTMGATNNIKELSNIIHKYNALFIVDGAQAISNIKIDVKDLEVDFYAFSGHKMYGPTGIGILYGKKQLLDNMEPISYGGEMIDSVSIDNTTYKDTPYKFEAGTMMISSVLGLGKAIDYINKIGIINMHNYVVNLRKYLIKQLQNIDNINIYNEQNEDSSIVLFNINNIHSHDIGSLLDKYNIIVRAGHHCCEPFMKYLKVDSTVRISLSFYNTKEEIDKLIEILMKAGDYINELF